MSNMDMVEMIKEIQAVDFAVYELSLFLDTHPDDREALDDHHKLARKSYQLKASFEEKYGPLRLDSLSEYPYRYINDPWPWEIVY